MVLDKNQADGQQHHRGRGTSGDLRQRDSNFHRRLTIALQFILLATVPWTLWERQWLAAALTVAILGTTQLPRLLGRRFSLVIPAEFEALAVAFVFASLFLGEVRGYYTRFWWWDIGLHTASGLLLGIFGFLLVYVLNEKRDIELHMEPLFVALFAFMFAVGVGALWEIFEFSMDQLAGTTMQKPMLGDPSGLTDTMWDLIVDSVGAAVISILGYGWLRATDEDSFLERWIRRFVDSNPRLFGG